MKKQVLFNLKKNAYSAFSSAIGIKCNKTHGEQSKLFKHHIILEDNSIKTFKPISQDELNIYINRTLRNPSHFIRKNEVNNLKAFLV